MYPAFQYSNYSIKLIIHQHEVFISHSIASYSLFLVLFIFYVTIIHTLLSLFISNNAYLFNSKLSGDILEGAIARLLAYSKGEKVELNGDEVQGKKRKFLETVEIQVTLKNYDPNKDKRFSGSAKLPNIPKPNMKICVLANEKHANKV